MKRYHTPLQFVCWSISAILLASCASYSEQKNRIPAFTKAELNTTNQVNPRPPLPNYAKRLPPSIKTHEKVIVVDPNVHAWGAYTENGDLIKAGLATAGNSWCHDIKRSCRTKAGTFRIHSLGSARCKSSIYPLPRGGAPMPYCMFFNKNQGLHGSYNVVEGNVSHGCVRLRVHDAEWLRFQFVRVGTKVIVRPY